MRPVRRGGAHLTGGSGPAARHGQSSQGDGRVGLPGSTAEETTTTTTDRRALRELRDKRGDPLGDGLYETAKENKIGHVT